MFTTPDSECNESHYYLYRIVNSIDHIVILVHCSSCNTLNKRTRDKRPFKGDNGTPG